MRKADECGQPGRCMMHSRLTLPGNFLSHALLRLSSRSAETHAPPCPQHPSTAKSNSWPAPTDARGSQHLLRPCPVRPWSSLAMPRRQRSSWPLFGARAEERVGQPKSAAKTQKNESLRKEDSTNLKVSRSKTSSKIVYIFL